MTSAWPWRWHSTHGNPNIEAHCTYTHTLTHTNRHETKHTFWIFKKLQIIFSCLHLHKNIQLHAICSLNFFHCFRTVSCMLYSVSFIININDLILMLITQFLYFCFFLYPVSHSMALSCISISFIFLYSESCILCPFCIKFMMFERSIEWI